VIGSSVRREPMMRKLALGLRRTFVVAALVMPLASIGADTYPADLENQDKLCEVTGEAPNVSVPPRDRLWFKENCTCLPRVGCGKSGSKRLATRMEVEKAVAEQRRVEAQKRGGRVVAARKAVRKERAAFWKCSDDPNGTVDCLRASEVLEAACKKHGLSVSYGGMSGDCYRKD
jgi:hypothetical protein